MDRLRKIVRHLESFLKLVIVFRLGSRLYRAWE